MIIHENDKIKGLVLSKDGTKLLIAYVGGVNEVWTFNNELKQLVIEDKTLPDEFDKYELLTVGAIHISAAIKSLRQLENLKDSLTANNGTLTIDPASPANIETIKSCSSKATVEDHLKAIDDPTHRADCIVCRGTGILDDADFYGPPGSTCTCCKGTGKVSRDMELDYSYYMNKKKQL